VSADLRARFEALSLILEIVAEDHSGDHTESDCRYCKAYNLLHEWRSVQAMHSTGDDARDALLSELKSLHHAYIGVLESGRDRIISLGGRCDSLDTMVSHDPHLICSKRAIDAAIAREKLK
jgi:hypothetical protein